MKASGILIVLVLFFANSSQAQSIAKGDTKLLNQLLNFTRIPALPVTDGAGNKFRLDSYIRENQLYPGKPILIVTWYTYCSGCKNHFDQLEEKGFGDKYNVVTILISIRNSKTKPKPLDEEIRTGKEDRNWSKFMNLVTDDSLADKYFQGNDATPLYVYADKNMNVYQYHISLNKKMVDVSEHIMSQIDKGKTSLTPGKRWVDEDGFPSLPEDDDRVGYQYAYKEGNFVFYKQAYKDSKPLSEARFIQRNGEFIYDGENKTYEDGKLKGSITYREGALTETFRRLHDNGKIAVLAPVNGIAKTFDSTGRLTMEGPMKNGLGDGVFKQYADGKLTTEVSLKAGEFDGPFKVYTDGKLSSTTYYRNGKEVK